MRLFLLICLATALIAGVISKNGNKNNAVAGVNPKKGNRKSTIAGVSSKKGKKKRTTKAVEEDGDWNKYETHPDKQLGPTNVNPNMGAEIVIPRNGK
ncbi:unnamed protein product [Cylicocyclus nassatus]|uniref:Uncharacterized protein n=1 Tax=Cylicocyclus nassatus TaxID=53992 RepID=A0AA36H0F1_CYLNA|nr:unnamed protein product [Cylicocyclus nassatus]